MDLVGNKVGRLEVLERHKVINKNMHYKCVCECGREVIVSRPNLRTKHTQSCGCYSREVVGKSNKTHGLSGTRLFHIHSCMKARCYNSKNPSFKNYGQRGINICREWLDSFETFAKWAMDNGYREDLEIDRINNDGNYEPSNCRWTTKKINTNNRRGYWSISPRIDRGITFDRGRGKWVVQIQIDNKKYQKRFTEYDDALKHKQEILLKQVKGE